MRGEREEEIERQCQGEERGRKARGRGREGEKDGTREKERRREGGIQIVGRTILDDMKSCPVDKDERRADTSCTMEA